MENLYRASSIIVLSNVSPKIVNLDRVNKIFQGLPKLAEQASTRMISNTGEQGIFRWKYKGRCTTKACSCQKAGNKCIEYYHRGNKCCKNC